MKNKLTLALIASLFAAGGAMAATSTDSQGVTTSTDPAKVAQIERHAGELKARQSGHSQTMAAHTSGTSSAKAGAHGSKHKKHARHQRSGANKAAGSSKQQG
jgi:hypothetical protein